MITPIEGLPEHAVGFTASGHVTKADYDTVLLPAVDEVADKTGELYFLYVIQTGIDHYTPGAMWDDLKVGLQHFTQWKKIAVVTSNKTIEHMTSFFSFAVPGKVKVYSLDQLNEAKKWISEK